MDPLSIAGSVAGLAADAFCASTAICTLLESTATVDTTISAFRSELPTRSGALSSISTTFRRPDVEKLHRTARQEKTTHGTLFDNVEEILED
jgi:phosphosulfolactate phosphohydrolase-like enzyme